MAECEVLARVNDEVILASDLSWEAQFMLQERLAKIPPEMQAEVTPEKVEQLRQQIMQNNLMSVVEIRMIYGDFRRRVPQANLEGIYVKIDEEWEKKELPKLMKNLKVSSLAELDQKLYSLGTSREERLKDFRVQTIARGWVTESVKIDREVTHEQMLEFYAEHAPDYDFPAKADWEELMVRYDQAPSREAAYGMVATMGNEAFALVAAQPDPSVPVFAPIAKQKSQGFTAAQGGLTRSTTQGALADEKLNTAIFETPLGQMSGIIEGDRGFHIIRVVKRSDAGRTPFAEVQNQIADRIRNERFSAGVKSSIAKIRRNTRIWTKFTGEVKFNELAEKAKETQLR